MPSRRELIQMTEEEVRDFLRGTRTLTIVSNGGGGYPHPMPMWFALDDDGTVRMTTFRKSQKVRNIERDPRVTLMAEAGEQYAELRGVVAYGKAELVSDPEVILDTLMNASTQGAPPQDPEARKALRAGLEKTAAKRVCIRIRPDRIVSWDHRKLGGTY